MRVRNALLPWRPSTSTDAARFEFALFIPLFLFDSFSTLELFFFPILFKKKLHFFSLRFKRFFFFLFIIHYSELSFFSFASFKVSSIFFCCFFFRNIPRFSKLRLIATRFFHSRMHRRPRYIVTIRTLICVSSRSPYSPQDVLFYCMSSSVLNLSLICLPLKICKKFLITGCITSCKYTHTGHWNNEQIMLPSCEIAI